MRMLIGAFAVAAALATASIAVPVGSAYAAGDKKVAKMAKAKPAKAVKGAKMKAKPAKKAAAKGKGPGSCGTYMYWKGGKCMDARLKK